MKISVVLETEENRMELIALLANGLGSIVKSILELFPEYEPLDVCIDFTSGINFVIESAKENKKL